MRLPAPESVLRFAAAAPAACDMAPDLFQAWSPDSRFLLWKLGPERNDDGGLVHRVACVSPPDSGMMNAVNRFDLASARVKLLNSANTRSSASPPKALSISVSRAV